MPKPYSNPTLHPDALTEDEAAASFKWHRAAHSPRSSQVFCLSAFGTLRKLSTRDWVMETLIRSALPELSTESGPGVWSLRPEAEDATLLAEYGSNQTTSIDMLCVSSDAVIAIESKFATDAQQGFGCCSQFPRSCFGFYGPGSDRSKGSAAWCRLESWEGRRSPRAYWSFGRQFFRPEAFRQQSLGEVCNLRGTNYQLMRNFLFAAAMAERDGKTGFGVVTIAPERFADGLRQQVAAFRDGLLQSAFANRVAFATYESFIELLRSSGDGASGRLADFLEERIASVIGA